MLSIIAQKQEILSKVGDIIDNKPNIPNMIKELQELAKIISE